MKKFTKGCLVAALILFLVGAVFCGVFGVLGGYEQLDQYGQRVYDIGFGGLKFGYHGNQFGFGYWDDDWEISSGALNLLDTTREMVKTSCKASDVTDILVSIGGNNLVIEESEDEFIWVQNDSSVKAVKYGMENGVFELRTGKQFHFFGIKYGDSGDNGKIYLYLPKGMKLETFDLELGGGNIESIALEADEMILEVGAGKMKMDGLTAETMDVSIGAGKADISTLNAQDVTLEIGAGTMKMDEFEVDNMVLQVGMGDLDAEGNIRKNADIECGMGNIDLILHGKESDYNYNVECAMGNIRIGESKFSNLAAERSVNNGSNCDFDVECGMGNITIDFKN